jgi:hypothetical protein
MVATGEPILRPPLSARRSRSARPRTEPAASTKTGEVALLRRRPEPLEQPSAHAALCALSPRRMAAIPRRIARRPVRDAHRRGHPGARMSASCNSDAHRSTNLAYGPLGPHPTRRRRRRCSAARSATPAAHDRLGLATRVGRDPVAADPRQRLLLGSVFHHCCCHPGTFVHTWIEIR